MVVGVVDASEKNFIIERHAKGLRGCRDRCQRGCEIGVVESNRMRRLGKESSKITVSP